MGTDCVFSRDPCMLNASLLRAESLYVSRLVEPLRQVLSAFPFNRWKIEVQIH